MKFSQRLPGMRMNQKGKSAMMKISYIISISPVIPIKTGNFSTVKQNVNFHLDSYSKMVIEK